MRKRYRLLPKAQIDLTEIIEYIAARSPDNAIKVFDDLHDAMRALAGMPGMGHTREDLTDRPVRFWTVHSYVIIYRPERVPLEVLRIIHGARDLQAILME